MDIKIYINNHVLDLYDDINIKFCKEFENDDTLEMRDVEYSYEVKIPATLNNNIIFGFQNDLNATRKFTQIYDATLEVKEQTLFNGKMIITEISQDCYKCNLYTPQVISLKDLLGDSQLSSITPNYVEIRNYNDINDINAQCVRAMNGNGEPPSIIFPYVVYGLPNTQPTDKNTPHIERWGNYFQDMQFSGTTFSLSNIYPAFNVCSILKDIFKTNGYELEGNIFENNKFKMLYQSYSGGRQDYEANIDIPYYASVDMNYTNGLNGDTPSDTMLEYKIHLSDDDTNSNHTYYGDKPNFSGSKFSKWKKLKDEYGLVDSNGVINIPQSGWYQIDCKGGLELPIKQMKGDNKKTRIHVCGWQASGSDDGQWGGKQNLRPESNFEKASYEFHIIKDAMADANYYGRYNTIPTCPNTVEGTFTTDKKLFGISTKKLANVKHYKNGDCVVVKDYSGIDTSSFLIGCQFGCQRPLSKKTIPEKHEEAYDLLASKDGCSMILRDWSRTQQAMDDSHTRVCAEYFNTTLDGTNAHYGYRQHAVLIKDLEDSYTNIKNFERNDKYEGQKTSECGVVSKTSGTFDLHACVWLEKGDQILAEVVMPPLFQGTKSAGLLKTGKDRKWRSGVVKTNLKYTLNCTLVNSHKEWKPTADNPIYSGGEAKKTNFNQFLGSTKCNDFVNSFLQTFNCRLTKKTSNRYSIDYNVLNEHMTNVVDFDKFANIEKVTSKRIQLPSEIQLKWKVDANERGYFLDKAERNSILVGESAFEYGIWSTNRDSLNVSHFDGSKKYFNLNNTNGSIKKYESIWSYTYMDFFKCVDSQNPTRVRTLKAPIICSQSDWEKNNLFGGYEGDTKKNPRLFYPQSPYIIRATSQSGRQSTTLDVYDGNSLKLSLLLVDNILVNKSVPDSRGKYKVSAFMLDYDNSPTNAIRSDTEHDSTITDLFYNNIKTYNKYNVSLKCILPTEVYREISRHSLAKLDNNLYHISKIDGFSVSEDSETTIMLTNM